MFLKMIFSILILNEPIKIKNKKVKFFFCFCAVDKNSHLNILNEFYSLISNETFINDIEKIKTYEQFYNFLKWRENV